ncbi:hypothetical protein KORDIASMS9_03766 [Kordia sp. SMS9]|uniref:hypothetical protein n=1 Tax=Kordia sp. SMS9 TaxID=2282170 RepID=UPI000E0DEF64|nr:hypothetical protein [Kordia sp. SMS9]AXG71509.1 hypothetical protein KORDIASMS9_03766 [Kordia sp. SMS9]
MKKKYVFILLLGIFSNCKDQRTHEAISYMDYKRDLQLIKNHNYATDCAIVNDLYSTVKSIDAKEKLIQLHGDQCNLHWENFESSLNSETVVGKLDQIMHRDQESRNRFTEIIYSKNLGSTEAKKIGLRKSLWDSIVKPIDSLNLVEFQHLIDSLGEWPGKYYIKQTPGNPKLSIIVSHMPTNEYKKYTIMALKSAQNGKEYWHRVDNMFNLSFRHNLEDLDLIINQRYIIPFIFTEYTSKDQIDMNAELTKIEFDKIIQNKDLETLEHPVLTLFCSVQDAKKRHALLEQSKSLLINVGYDESKIQLINSEFPHNEYRLYYEIKY